MQLMLDVIVPAYRGLAVTVRCLESVLACTQRTAFELVVVDDASPEPALSAWLQQLSDVGRITLLRNAHNLGFVRSVNRALALHPERDAVLLNSDTEVAGDWLDRLLRCAANHPDAATITPFSNNATICSYPYEGWAGDVPGRLGLAALDALFARHLAGAVADLPTGVGFCMFLRRACLDAVGLFDEVAFPRGYGEENDLCRRAAKAGWRNLLCADVFVYHRGGVSFAQEREALMQQGAARLQALHPEYAEAVARFIADDPLGPLRAVIDAARAAQSADEAAEVARERAARPPAPLPQVLWQDAVRHVGMDRVESPACNTVAAAPVPQEVWLHVAHSWGGGVARWVHDMAGADATRARHLVLRSRSWRNQAGVRLELVEPALADEVLLAWNLEPPIDFCATAHTQYRAILADLVAAFDVRAVVVSSLIGHALEALETGLPTIVVLHDLFPFCPALFGWFGQSCTECGADTLARCFTHNPLNVFWQHADVARWQALREAYGARLSAQALTVVAPSRSVYERYAKLLPALRTRSWHCIAHGLARAPAALLPRPAQRLKVLVPGRLAPHKGLDLLRQVLPQIGAFADVLLLGCGDFGMAFAGLPHVQSVNDYAQAQLAAHVAAFAPDCALLLSTLPETFSYTLSEMQALGIPVLASAHGAFAERIVEGHNGFLVAPQAAEVVGRLKAWADERRDLAEVAARLRQQPVRTATQMVADYRALLPARALGAAPASGRVLQLLCVALADARCRQRMLDEQLSQARQAVAKAEAEYRAVAESLSRERARNAYVEGDLAGRLGLVQAERDALLASTSWKVTAPLRWLKGAKSGWLAEGANPEVAASTVAVPDEPLPEPPAVDVGGDPVIERRIDRLLAEWPAGAPSRQVLARFADGTARVDADVPVAGDWAGRWAPYVAVDAAEVGSRAALRAAQRDRLGLPDGGRIVLGIGSGGADSGVVDFARIAMAVGDSHNGVFFVWLGALDAGWVQAQGEGLALPQALRRLFVLDDPVFEPWLLAADLYLSCRRAPGQDAGALEALACALPVVTLGTDVPAAEPERTHALMQRLNAVTQDGAASSLCERLAQAARLRQVRGCASAWVRFVAACRAALQVE